MMIKISEEDSRKLLTRKETRSLITSLSVFSNRIIKDWIRSKVKIPKEWEFRVWDNGSYLNFDITIVDKGKGLYTEEKHRFSFYSDTDLNLLFYRMKEQFKPENRLIDIL